MAPILTTRKSLKERFEICIESLQSSEVIDVLLKGQDLHEQRRADYLLCNRKIIVELKELCSDQMEKAKVFASDLIAQRGLLVFGTVAAQSIFASLPDGDERQRDLLLRITRQIEGDIVHADQQTEGTRKIFSIPDATGILIILNDKIRILTPEVIHYRLAHVFQRKAADGTLRYPHNNGVILISEHQDAAGENASHFLSFTNPNGKSADIVAQFSSALWRVWQKLNNYTRVIVI